MPHLPAASPDLTPAPPEQVDSLFASTTILAATYGECTTEFRSYSSTPLRYSDVQFSAQAPIEALRSVGNEKSQAKTAAAIGQLGAAGSLVVISVGDVVQSYEELSFTPRSSGLILDLSASRSLPYLSYGMHVRDRRQVAGHVSLVEEPIPNESLAAYRERRAKQGRPDYITAAEFSSVSALLHAARHYWDPLRKPPAVPRFLALSMPAGGYVEIDPRPRRQ